MPQRKLIFSKMLIFFGEEIKWAAKLSLPFCSPSLLSTYCSDQSDISTCSGADGGNFPPDGDLHSPVRQLGASISASSISRSAGQKGGAGETYKHDHPWEVNRESLSEAQTNQGPWDALSVWGGEELGGNWDLTPLLSGIKGHPQAVSLAVTPAPPGPSAAPHPALVP